MHDQAFQPNTTIGATAPAPDALPIVIRPALDMDGGGIGALIARVFADYPNCPFVPAEFPELDAIATHFAQAGGLLLVATQGGAIVGTAGVAPTSRADSFEIKKVYVAHGARRSGLASRLLEVCLAFARSNGAARVDLFSDTRFAEGHAFYARQGFEKLPGERYLADAADTWEFHFARAL